MTKKESSSAKVTEDKEKKPILRNLSGVNKKEKVKKTKDKIEKEENRRTQKDAKEKKEIEVKDDSGKKEEAKSKQKEDIKDKKKPSKKVKQKPRIRKRGKKYKEVSKLVDKNNYYLPEEAMYLVLKTSTTKFDSAVEIHIRLGIKTEHSDQNIRTVVDLPEGTGKKIKVAAIVSSQREKEVKEAGADFVGNDNLISKIEKGFLGFDILVATPDMMGKIGKLGKALGTKGLMPNPKTETVTDKPERVVKLLKKGRIELRNDKQGIVHASFGKVSLGNDKLISNLKILIEKLSKTKPSQVKGQFIKSVVICTTMGASVTLNEDKLLKLIQRHYNENPN